MRVATSALKLALVLVVSVLVGALAVTADEPAPVSAPAVEEALDLSTLSQGPEPVDACAPPASLDLEDYCQCHCKLCANPLLGGGRENCRICQSSLCNPG